MAAITVRTYTTIEERGAYAISRVDDLTPDGEVVSTSYLVLCPDSSQRPFLMLHVARAYVSELLAQANATPLIRP